MSAPNNPGRMEAYRLHHPGGFPYDGRMDLHIPAYERMRMQHRMYHHHPPPALYPQFRPAPPEPMPRYDTRQQQEVDDGEMMSSQTVEGKKRLIIFPRRKAGQKERDINNVAPVHLTLETIEEIADVPLLVAAKQLGISKTALKNACRHLGLERWPFRRRMQNARLQSKAAEKAASQMREAAAAESAAAAASSPQRSSQPAAVSGVGKATKQEMAIKKEREGEWAERSNSHRRALTPSGSQPSERSHSSASTSPRFAEDDRFGAFYSALTTPNASTTASDDQTSPINPHPQPARAPALAPAFFEPIRSLHPAAPMLQAAKKGTRAARHESRDDDGDWIDARVRGVSPRLPEHAAAVSLARRGVSPQLLRGVSPNFSAIAEDALHLPPHYAAGQLERGLNNAVHGAEAHKELKELHAELGWVMDDEQHAMWEEAECSYALPVMYQPIGNV